jgi:hypothetical protein
MISQANSWGGQLELQSMSQFYKVNFAIYAAHSPVTEINNGFPRTITLWYSHGSHYDIIYPLKIQPLFTFGQELVYQMVEHAMDPRVPALPSSRSNYRWRNIEFGRYRVEQEERFRRDRNLATAHADNQVAATYQEEEDRRLAMAIYDQQFHPPPHQAGPARPHKSKDKEGGLLKGIENFFMGKSDKKKDSKEKVEKDKDKEKDKGKGRASLARSDPHNQEVVRTNQSQQGQRSPTSDEQRSFF